MWQKFESPDNVFDVWKTVHDAGAHGLGLGVRNYVCERNATGSPPRECDTCRWTGAVMLLRCHWGLLPCALERGELTVTGFRT